MFTVVRNRLLACCAMALFGLLYHAGTAAAWSSGPSDRTYHTIIDDTQNASINVVVTNTQATNSARSYPYIGSDTDPWAAINPNLYPTGYTPPTPDLYVNVKFSNSNILSNSLSTATIYTCDQGSPSKCPSGTVPTTFVHRLGTYNSGTQQVTPLNNAKLSGGTEVLNNMFENGSQAFDVDRLRYVANRLWYQWKTDKLNNTGWATRFTYQPTGTMSFENFVNNIVNHHTMYGIVRVVIPVNQQSKSNFCGKHSTSPVGDMYMDVNQPIDGNEFTTSHVWTPAGTCNSSPTLSDYEAMYDSSITGTQDSGTMNVYGMVLIDYVDQSTYDPSNFFGSSQDYIDDYSSVAAHDAASLTGRENVILPRSSGRNIVLMDWDTLNINAVDDLQSFVQYTDTHTAGPDGRMDTLDIARRKYMMGGSTAYQASEISDAYVWEYWMRKAAALPVGNSTRTAILNDLTAGGGTPSQYNISTQTFTAGATRRTDFNNTEWGSMAEQDKFHAYFPNGYERGWMIAFAALRLDLLDQTTTEKTTGSWWMHLPDDVAGVDGGSMHAGRSGKAYPEFEVPLDSEALTVDIDSSGNIVTSGTAVKMPNFFTTEWEDLPAFAFAGGLLDVHGFMNVSGMLYTPDSCEIEAHAGSEVPGGSNSAGPFQYVNGALLVGNGLWLEDQNTGDHSMIAISYNYNSFDKLRTPTPRLTIMKAENISELKGQ
jgi:hypothetical protein